MWSMSESQWLPSANFQLLGVRDLVPIDPGSGNSRRGNTDGDEGNVFA